MRIYHIKRNFDISYKEQKKQIMREYENVEYVSSDGRTITVFAGEWRKDDEEVSDAVE